MQRRPGRSRVPGAERAQRASARAAAFAGLPPALTYPPDLPITARKDELLAAVAANQVVIVAGETGSGKSTQLPKICLEAAGAGGAAAGMVGHTQPRRIAARSVAARVAEELGVDLGGPVGYRVRFTDRVSDSTLVKVMTDGVLLAELAGDPRLSAYSTVIVDEAHERSLNIDFVLGYLALLLPLRPDLKVVITSATIDTESFSRHFGGAPVVEVAGRTYPVEIRYRPFQTGADEDDASAEEPGEPPPGDEQAPGDGPAGEPVLDEVQAVCDAVGELSAEGPGDILVFLAGEAEIRDASDALAKPGPPGLEILPLYGRLSSAEQHRIFEPHSGRRVVLATNVAETSITVPGIRYVVDAGTARISRYSRRTKVQRLPIEPVSQASADQRAGRCGRLGPGICVRLYSEDEYQQRRRFTEPEILRTNLASVLLQMATIGLPTSGGGRDSDTPDITSIERFPFIDPPERRNVRDGIAVLEELGAFTRQGAGGPLRLTPLGRRLARLPLDPRLGRMVLQAADLGCLPEVLVIASGLAVQDPRERPAAKRQQADALHQRFDDQSSDFVSYLALWDYLGGRRGELSSGQFRRLCQREFISYQRAREWQDVHAELESICREAHSPPQPRPDGTLTPSRRALVHRALLAGIVTQIGVREGERKDFAAPRGARFSLWPGSVLAKKLPRWVMVAELTETGRLWGRVAAPVKPQWAERAASHLLQWSYGEPAWDPGEAEAVVVSRATLFGLPVVPGRHTPFAQVGGGGKAREMFVRNALVDGDWERAPDFVAKNIALVENLAEEARKSRRLGLAPGRGELFAFYERRVPGEVRSGRSFEDWWRKAGPEEREALEAAPEDLGALPSGLAEGFPDTWLVDGEELPVDYDWEGAGVTVEVPLAELGRVRDAVAWQVPGLRADLVGALLRSLPKDLRRELAPIGERAREFVAKASPEEGPLDVVLARSISRELGAQVRPSDFDWSKVPAHLRPALRVVGAGGRVLASGKDSRQLETQLRPLLDRALAEAASSPSLSWGPPGRRSARWDFGSLPRVFEADYHGQLLSGFPALVDDGDAVKVAVLADEVSQQAAMAAGSRRLLALNLPSRRQLVSTLERMLDKRALLALGALRGLGYGSSRELAGDVVSAALDEVVADNGGPPWDAGAFASLVDAARRDVEPLARRGLASAGAIISELYEAQRRLDSLRARAQPGLLALALEDAGTHLASLGAAGFVSRAGLARLADVERYVTALCRRLDKLPADPVRDVELAQRARALGRRLDEASGPAERLEELRWLLEELRVSFFAQSLGTKVPVSEARFLRALSDLG